MLSADLRPAGNLEEAGPSGLHEALPLEEADGVSKPLLPQEVHGAGGRREQGPGQTPHVLQGQLQKKDVPTVRVKPVGAQRNHFLFDSGNFLEVPRGFYPQPTMMLMLASLSCTSRSPPWTGHTSCRPAKGDTVMVRPTGRIGRLSVKPPSIHL